MTDIQRFKDAALAIDENTTADACAAMLDKLAAFMAAAKEMKAMCEDRLMWWIKTTGQDIVIGERRYYVGTDKPPPDCTDKPATLEELFKACNGDFAKVAEFLSASPFKYGACRGQLAPKVYARLFVVTPKEELKEGEAKPEKLLVADGRFSKSS